MKTLKQQLKEKLVELKALQDQHKGKTMPEDIGAKCDALAAEAEEFQKGIDREERTRAIEEKASKVTDPVTPGDDQPPPTPTPKSVIAGAMTLGDFVAAQKAHREFLAAGMPKQQYQLAAVKSLFGRGKQKFSPIVMLNEAQVREFKAVPTIADTVIEPQRISDLVRVTEHDRLTLRDVLDVVPTSSNAIKYIRITNYTRAAAVVAVGATKPEATLEMDSVTEPIKTLAVHIPVENTQLEDQGELAGIINGELLYDLAKLEEEEAFFGDGTGEHFTGIVETPGVDAMRSDVGDTLIDITRRGITDVRRAGYEPNAIVIDPLDWESIVLEKGTDNRYVWVVVTEGDTMRLWAVRVVETVAAEDGVFTPGRRVIVVGDFRRGATLYDRGQASISVGWINTQFIQNRRTILAEERVGFAVKRPGAFRIHETDAGS
jgi:HK97 family phage major capsid protein